MSLLEFIKKVEIGNVSREVRHSRKKAILHALRLGSETRGVVDEKVYNAKKNKAGIVEVKES